MKFSRFVRGQVWYWVDPIYGSKSERKLVPIDEQTIRYSRPVLIVQDASTMNRSILVAPISTTFEEAENEKAISVMFTNPEGKDSRIAIGSIMPVSPMALTNYKYTFTEDAMNEIMGKLAILLGLKLSPLSHRTNNESSELYQHTQVNNTEPTKEIIPAPVSTSNNQENELEPDPEINIPRTAKGRIMWNDELKKQFLEMYDTLGSVKTAKIFGISKSTVGTTKHRFTADVNKSQTEPVAEIPEQKPVASKSVDTVAPKPILQYIPTEEEVFTKQLVSSISEFCNLMRRHANDNRLDTYISLYGSDEMLKDKHATEKFYSKLSASWYYALLKFFNIEEVKGSALPISIIPESDKRYELYKILTDIFDSRIHVKSGTVKTLLDGHRKTYGTNWVMPQEVIDEVRVLLSKKISMKERAFNRIIEIYAKLLGGNTNDN